MLSYKTISLAMLITTLLMNAAFAGNFYKDCEITWGNAKIIEGGKMLTLKLDNTSGGSGFQSKSTYIYGRFDVKIKLIPNNSAGTVTTFYLTSDGPSHDEIDFEFLGNVSGQPYTVHTNVFAQGKGGKEQQFHLWFNPTLYFHTYSIVWNKHRIIFLIDNIPIRVYNNNAAYGIPFPTNKPMRLIGSLWNADDWATQGGRIKTNWNDAPFFATYTSIDIKGHACSKTGCSAAIGKDSLQQTQAWENQEIDAAGKKRIKWVDAKYKIYDYCADRNRFKRNVPAECRRPRF